MTVEVIDGRVGRVKTACSEDQLPLDPQFAEVLKRWRSAPAENLGLAGVGWHTFRKLMRHAQVSTTLNVYGKVFMESKRDANSKWSAWRCGLRWHNRKAHKRIPQRKKAAQQAALSENSQRIFLMDLSGPALHSFKARKFLILWLRGVDLFSGAGLIQR